MESKGYLSKGYLCKLILMLIFHLCFKNLSFLLGGRGASSWREIYVLLLSRQEEGRELFLHQLILSCLQLNIIFVSKWHIWGWHILTPLTIPSTPSPWYSVISSPSCFLLFSYKYAQASLISMVLPGPIRIHSKQYLLRAYQDQALMWMLRMLWVNSPWNTGTQT